VTEKLEPTNSLNIGSISFSAFGDRILIQEDEFKSGYECETCSGSGQAVCSNCEGAGILAEKFKCSHCNGAGHLTCPACSGKGGVLIVPEVSQRRPTTGTIVSVGESVKALRVGQSVRYSSFAGHTVELSRAGSPLVLRIIHEPEVLCLVEGHLSLSHLRSKSDIAQYQGV
jgi:co-chaperonin GroES (HSP10)